MGTEPQHDRYVHRLTIPLVFPTGLAPRSRSDGNRLLLATTAEQQVVLRGTAVAGILRHAYARRVGKDPEHEEVRRWFGHASGAKKSERLDRPSCLHVADTVLDSGVAPLVTRRHNSMDRHTGAVRDGGVFSIESLPAGTKGTLVLHLHLENEEGAEEFLKAIVGEITAGLHMGGQAARGIGLARLDRTATTRCFDLENLGECAAWLDESWGWRTSGQPPSDGTPLIGEANSSTLHVQFRLKVPRGQDVCIGDGIGLDYTIEPQRSETAQGKDHWKLPGSTLRGVFRAWVTRLAARAAKQGDCPAPADSVERFVSSGAATGEDAGWGFRRDERKELQKQLASGLSELNTDEVDRRVEETLPCPVTQLFGSQFNAGRIHIMDAMSEMPVREETEPQARSHVAIDRITGGANEGFLFSHEALLSGPEFVVTMTVRKPKEREAKWLADTLRALSLGVLRVGCSKSSGRLGLAATPTAHGQYADFFTSISAQEN